MLLEVKAWCAQPKEAFHWLKLASGYEVTTLPSTYGRINQRWQLIYAEQAYQRALKTLQQPIAKKHHAWTNPLWHLKHQLFNCLKNAAQVIAALEVQTNYHTLTCTLQTLKLYVKKGHPQGKAIPPPLEYCMLGELLLDQTCIQPKEQALERGHYPLMNWMNTSYRNINL